MKYIVAVLLLLSFSFPALSQMQAVKAKLCKSCVLLSNFNNSLNTIADSAEELFQEDATIGDGCLTTIVDSLKTLFLKTGDEKYLKVYNSIACVSDGYLSELFDNSDTLLFTHFIVVTHFLQTHGDTSCCMVNYLKENFAYDKATKGGKEKMNRLFAETHKLEKKYNAPKEERNMMDAIIRKSQKGVHEYFNYPFH